jgi:hypothetical protein
MTGLILVIGASALVYVIWLKLAALIGRYLARRDPVVLTEQEIADAGRPYVDSIDVMPIYTPNGHTASKGDYVE